jgi:hypothetical protein
MKKRDSAYYRKRLAKDHPLIFAEVLAGRLSVRAASAKAKLIRLPTRLDALKRDWKRATPSELAELAKWARPRLPKRVRKPIADSSGRLRPEVRDFLSNWLETYGSRAGRIMKVMGFRAFDWRLAHAIDDGGVLPQEVIDKLQPWMIKNGFTG